MLKIKVLDSKMYSRLKSYLLVFSYTVSFPILVPRQKGSSSLESSFKEYTFFSSSRGETYSNWFSPMCTRAFLGSLQNVLGTN